MTRDQRDLAIWGGGAFTVAIIVYAVFISGLADSLDATQVSLDTAFGDYQKFYGSRQPTDRPAQEAIDRAEADRKAQAGELAALEAAFLSKPGHAIDDIPKEFIRNGRLHDFASPEDPINQSFSKSQSLVGEVNTRLGARARIMGLPIPAQLPFQDKGEIETDGERAGSILRGLQLAEVCCYAALMDMAMEVFEYGDKFKAIESVKPEKSMRCSVANGRYAVVSVSLSLKLGYASADQLMRRLSAHRGGLVVRSLHLTQQEDTSQRLELTGSLVIDNNSEWKLPAMAVANQKPGPQPGSSSGGSKPPTGGGRVGGGRTR